MKRLKWPLELAESGTSLATVEQDSDEDIVQCLRAILLHRPGDRVDLPDMGVPDPTFGEQPLDTAATEEVLRRHEPRVDLLVTSQPDLIDRLIADTQVAWEPDTETPEADLG